MADVIYSNGQTNCYHNMGYDILFCIIGIYTVIVIVETKNFTAYVFALYTISFLLFVPVCTFLSDVRHEGNAYYRNQFSYALASPLLYLQAVLVIFVAIAPRYIWICLERSVWRPEFNKVKGR